MPELRQERSVAELFGQLSQDMTLLVRQEIQLARSEMSEKLSRFTANLISAALRTVPLGQSDGQLALAALETAVDAATRRAIVADSLDDVGTSTPLLDWCSLKHETQYTRLFRS